LPPKIAAIEIERINLTDDEFARFTGYLYALKEDGLLDFVLTPMG
jgi:hypothetical protein